MESTCSTRLILLLLWQRLKASASRIVSVNVPQRFLRLLYTIIGSCSSLVLVASVIVGTRLVVLGSEEDPIRIRGQLSSPTDTGGLIVTLPSVNLSNENSQ